MGYNREREVAVEAVREAARLCVDVRKSLVGAMEKEDRSPVTVADFGSQALVCRRLKSVFPEDPIVGGRGCGGASRCGADVRCGETGVRICSGVCTGG